jgi:hypothetical protein
MSNAKIGAAVLAGYVLGRTKKAKLAMSLGAMLAGSRVKPGHLGKLLEESPFLGNVSNEVRSELAGAGKAAATTVLSAKAESLADAIHERTEGLREKAHPDGKHKRGEAEGETEQDDKGEESEDEGRRSRGREKKAQHGGSDKEGEPRKGRTAARKRAPEGRSKSGSTRLRRPDDG